MSQCWPPTNLGNEAQEVSDEQKRRARNKQRSARLRVCGDGRRQGRTAFVTRKVRLNRLLLHYPFDGRLAEDYVLRPNRAVDFPMAAIAVEKSQRLEKAGISLT